MLLKTPLDKSSLEKEQKRRKRKAYEGKGRLCAQHCLPLQVLLGPLFLA